MSLKDHELRTPTRLRVLIIGKGGREHALAWKLSDSPLVERIYVVPGNGGTEATTSTSPSSSSPNNYKICNVQDVPEDDYTGLVNLATKLDINLAVPGTDSSVVGGIEGYFRAAGIPCFAPSKGAARIEGSKSLAKDFMRRHGIPTAEYRHFNEYAEAKEYIDGLSYNVVLKASGLAAGKGVIIPKTKQEADEALEEIMVGKRFGAAGDEVIIEEFLEGEELSIHSFSDGIGFKSLPPAQDHKSLCEGDVGPNTGGMGCYAPAYIQGKPAPVSLLKQIEDDIIKPTFEGLAKEGNPFVGMLFTGVMVTANGIKVLEYNARFGDPETQTLLPLLESDLAEIMVACVEQSLHKVNIRTNEKCVAAVVIVADGYPGEYHSGEPITLGQLVPSDTVIFHAGTKVHNWVLQTSGGRVITVTSTSDSIRKAVEKSYAGVETVNFDGMVYRRDIAHRAIGFRPQ